jgi:hypothetical protein
MIKNLENENENESDSDSENENDSEVFVRMKSFVKTVENIVDFKNCHSNEKTDGFYKERILNNDNILKQKEPDCNLDKIGMELNSGCGMNSICYFANVLDYNILAVVSHYFLWSAYHFPDLVASL